MKGLRHFIKPVVILSILIVLYALAGFIIVPAVLQGQLPDIIHRETGRDAAIENLSFDPFAMKMAVKGFELKETDGQTFAGFKDFYIDIAGFDSIAHWHLVIDKITLIAPLASIVKNPEGDFNFADLTGEDLQQANDEEPSEMFSFLLRSLAVSEGSVIWEDLQLAKPQKETLASINLALNELNSVGPEPAALEFSFVSDSGSTLAWHGSVAIKPLQSQGAIKLEKVGLSRMGQFFLPEAGDFKVKDGELNLSLDYVLNAAEDGFSAEIKPSLLSLENLKLIIATKPGQTADVTAKSLKLQANYTLGLSGDDLTIKTDTAKLAISTAGLKPTAASAEIPDVKVSKLAFEAVYTADIGKTGFKLDIGQGKFDLERLKLALKPHKETLEAELGRLTASTDLTLDPDMVVKVKQGKIGLNDLKLTATGQEGELVNIPAIEAIGVKADTGKQTIALASLTSKDGALKAWLNPDGQFNYLTLFKDEGAGQAVSEPEAEGKPWQFAVDKIAINGYQIAFTDQTQTTPVHINLADLAISIEQLTHQTDQKLPVQLQARVNEAGSITIGGSITPEPLLADLELELDNLALKTFQPYLEKHVRLDLIEGDISASGKTLLAFSDKDEPDLKFQGDAHIDRLVTRDQVQRRDFVKWRKLDLGRITVDLAANNFIFEDIRFNRPYIRVLIKKDGTTNFNDIVAAAEIKDADQSETDQASDFNFKIGKIEVKQGLSDFADYSLILPFVTQMNNLDGDLTGISSDPGATAELSLQGKVYNVADVGISGSYQLDSGDSEIELKFRDMPLPLVTPYMAEFAGYKIEKGQMSLDLKYTIDKGRLEAQNNLFIDQFTLGEKVENPNAVSLPLSMAIALLKDSKGQINLDLPISGSLDDPEFSVGSLVMKALGNLISKIVTAPFRAIGSMFDGEQDLSVVSFASGSARLDKTEQAKLDVLAKALKDRLALKLEIKGAAFEEHDWPGLRSGALNDQLKSLRAKELRAEGRRIRAEYIELSEDDEKRLLAQLFIEKFPLLAEYSFFGTPKLKEQEQGDFYEIARQKLEATLAPDKQRLNDLAVHRAGAISNYLIAEGGIPGNRIFLLATELDPVRKEPGITTTLSLGAR